MKHGFGAAACLAALGLCVWWLIHPPAWNGSSTWYVLMASAWLLFAAGAWLVRRAPRRAAIGLIVVGGIGLPLAAGFAPPRTSDDLYRYIWDGRVQAQGVDPYRYVPAAPQLLPLRDDFLWPQRSAWCVGHDDPHLVAGCTLINRPAVHTIYPPAAQLYFLGVQALSSPSSREGPIQSGAALAVAAVTLLLIVALPKAGVDPRLAVWWAWCPLVVIEAGNNAHVDVVSTFFAVAALLCAALAKSWRGTATAAVLFGLAVATKLNPVLIGPSLLRRRPWTVVTVGATTLFLVYLPHVIAVGPKVLGYLPGYLDSEGYRSGSRFALLALVFPPPIALAVAAVILAGAAAVVWWRTDPDRPWASAVVLVGVSLLIATTNYSWYAILLVALAAMSNRPEWIAVAAAGYVAQYSANLHLGSVTAERLGYGVAALVVLGTTVVRRRLAR